MVAGRLGPVLGIILFSAAQILLTTLTLASVSKLTPKAQLGIAFGLVEVLDGVFSMFTNSLFALLYKLSNGYGAGMAFLLALAYVGCTMVFLMTVVRNRPFVNIAHYLPLQ